MQKKVKVYNAKYFHFRIICFVLLDYKHFSIDHSIVAAANVELF